MVGNYQHWGGVGARECQIPCPSEWPVAVLTPPREAFISTAFCWSLNAHTVSFLTSYRLCMRLTFDLSTSLLAVLETGGSEGHVYPPHLRDVQHPWS